VSVGIAVSHPTLENCGSLHFAVQAHPEAADVPLAELLERITDNDTWREEQ